MKSLLGHYVLDICFRSDTIQILMSEGRKKTKKNIEPIKVNEGDQIKKQISRKVIEGGEIKNFWLV